MRVALGDVDVGGDCMIRVLHNKGLIITYHPDGDYSQYQARRNFIFYRPGGDMAVWTPGGGWADPMISRFMQPILGGASVGQILGHFGSPIPPGLGNIDRPGADVGATLAHLPVLLTDTFSFSAVSAMPSDDGKVARPESTPCPTRGTEGCVRLVQKLQGEQLVTAFDSRRRLVGLLFGGHMFVFEYGVFEIRRPPGW